MQAVMLITGEPGLLPAFKMLLEQAFPLDLFNELGDRPGFVVEFPGNSRIYVEYAGTDLESIGWDEDETALIIKQFINTQHVYSIDYHDIDIVKQVLILLANSDHVIVDNDGGNLMIGSAMVAKIVNEPNWNWLQDDPEEKRD